MKNAAVAKLFNRVPNALRERLLQEARGHGALVYEFVLFVLASSPFAVKQLTEHMAVFGVEMTRRQIDNGLADVGLFINCGLEKNGVGRPSVIYCARPLTVVLEREGLSGCRKIADALAVDDLKNVPAYRVALHREMILREQEKKTLPHGRYRLRRGWVKFTRAWEARRLGVHKRTVRRYDKVAGVGHQEDISREELYFADTMPERDNMWLEQEGRKYPALRKLAEKLLRKGSVTIATQHANYYWIPAQ